MRPHRPFLVGLVCWTLIVSGSLGVFVNLKDISGPGFAAFLDSFPYPPVIAGTILFGSFTVWTVAGICMYEGLGWARFVYPPVALLYFIQECLLILHMNDVNSALTVVNPAAEKALDHLTYLESAKFVFFLGSIVFVFLPRARRFFHPPTYIDE